MIHNADNLDVIITDSRLAFMQGGYEESLRLAKQALVTKTGHQNISF